MTLKYMVTSCPKNNFVKTAYPRQVRIVQMLGAGCFIVLLISVLLFDLRSLDGDVN